jgi:hypothetical protein
MATRATRRTATVQYASVRSCIWCPAECLREGNANGGNERSPHVDNGGRRVGVPLECHRVRVDLDVFRMHVEALERALLDELHAAGLDQAKDAHTTKQRRGHVRKR